RIQLREQGYEMTLRPRFRAVTERLGGAARAARLSPAALETLALGAYRQPGGREDIDTVRGADSLALLRQLVRLGLVAVQHGAGSGALYATTPRFLQLFELRGLDDLPRTQDLQKL